MAQLNSILVEGDLKLEYIPTDLFVNKAQFTLKSEKIKSIPVEINAELLFDRVINRFSDYKVTEISVRVVGSLIGKEQLKISAEHIEFKYLKYLNMED